MDHSCVIAISLILYSTRIVYQETREWLASKIDRKLSANQELMQVETLTMAL